jgi:hypothetical protein
MNNEFYEHQKLVAIGTDSKNNEVEAIVLFSHYLSPTSYKEIKLSCGEIGFLDCVINVENEQNYACSNALNSIQ